jgi:Putative DNA-binding domain
MLTEGFFRLAMSATGSGREVTLRQIFSALEFDIELSTLEQLARTRTALTTSGLRIRPSFDAGDLDTIRLLTNDTGSQIDASVLLTEIQPGEGALVEFKQSAFFNWKRFQSQPGATTADLQSEEVTFTFLKTIAAFLNSSGGRLFIGVKDDSSLCGIEKDFPYCKSHNQDGWELKIRDLIKSRFHDGDSINNYVDIDIVSAGGVIVARASISKRAKLSFLIGKDRSHLFCRQGNRTIEIGIEDVEEFLQSRSILK